MCEVHRFWIQTLINAMGSFLDHNFWIRAVIINLPIQIFCVKVAELFLGKMKKPGYLLTYMILKGAVMCYFQSLGDHISATGRMIEILAGALGGIAMCLLCFYLFEAKPTKILFAIAIAEFTATCCMMPSIILVNIMEKRTGSVFGWYLRFQMMDMLSWPIELMLFLFIYAFLKKFREPFQNCEIRHNRLIWMIYLCYFLVMQTSQVMEIETGEGFQRGMILPCMMVTAATILGIAVILARQNKMVKNEGKFLQLELSMMESQYHAMQYQRAYMEECQKLIDSQMQEILQKEEKGTAQIRTEKYLEDLKHAYQKIHAGIYCKDWTLDSILYVETERTQQEGIVVTCKVQNTPEDTNAVECMGKVLVKLFEEAISECKKEAGAKKIDVQIDVIASQAVVVFTCPIRKKATIQRWKKELNGLTEERNGNTEIETIDGKRKVCVMFVG